MARIVETITAPVPPEVAFDLVADFTTTAEWDPLITAARRLPGGPGGPGLGDRVEVDLAMGSRTIPVVYATTVHDRPRRVVLEARGAWFRGVDDIRVAPGDAPGTSRVTWDATFALRGPLSLLDPLLARGFRRVAAKAVEGLAVALRARSGPAGGPR
jgi:hypothetical protein